MNHTIGAVAGKPDDYKVCSNCNSINWYENDSCHNCDKTKFKNWSENKAQKWLDNELNFYKENYPEMSEESVMDMETDV